jgi:hypothetical protein
MENPEITAAPILIQPDPVKLIISDIIAQRTGLSYTALSNFAESPRHFIDYKMQKVEETPAMLYGSMLHCLILEPDDFLKRYFVFDDTAKVAEIGGGNPRNTNAYRQWKAEQFLTQGERKAIDPQEYQHAKIVALNVRYNRASSEIMNACPIREQKVNWIDYNFAFRGIKDLEGDDIIADIKSCPDANPEAFGWKIRKERLALQAYMYVRETKKVFYWIAVDKLGGVSVHYCKPSWIEWGREEYNRLLIAFNDCIIRDAWDQSYDFWAPYWNGIYDAEKPAYL